MSAFVFYLGIALQLVSSLHSLDISESTGDNVVCTRSKVDENVTLASGHRAGSFLKANRSIKDMVRCVEQCCLMRDCDVAFFSNGACYSVKCNDIETCAPKANTDKRMTTSISFVARPKKPGVEASVSDSSAEPALTEDLIAETTNESPFASSEEGELAYKSKRRQRENWTEYRDIIIALTSGFAAVAVGVLGVITMTRKLVEDDDIYTTEDDIWNDSCTDNSKSPSASYGRGSLPVESVAVSKTTDAITATKGEVSLHVPTKSSSADKGSSSANKSSSAKALTKEIASSQLPLSDPS